jgi:hypothetical protein
MTEIFTISAGIYDILEYETANWVMSNVECNVWKVYENGTKMTTLPYNHLNFGAQNATDVAIGNSEIAECTFTNNNAVGFFTGGGRVNLNQTDGSPNHAEISLDYDTQKIDKVTHGFELHCDSNSGPNNLEVDWLGNSFHLEQLVSALCYSDGTVNEPPANPNANGNGRKPILDVYYGEGYGRYNGQCGAHAQWVMDDNGEPGKADQIVALVITNSTGDLVLNINPDELDVINTSISGEWYNGYTGDGEPWLDLESGNHQWTPHPFKSHGPQNTTPCDPIP